MHRLVFTYIVLVVVVSVCKSVWETVCVVEQLSVSIGHTQSIVPEIVGNALSMTMCVVVVEMKISDEKIFTFPSICVCVFLSIFTSVRRYFCLQFAPFDILSIRYPPTHPLVKYAVSRTVVVVWVCRVDPSSLLLTSAKVPKFGGCSLVTKSMVVLSTNANPLVK